MLQPARRLSYLFGGSGIYPCEEGDSMPEDEAGVIARLFAQEGPEIAAGTVQIKAIAREPGLRSKLAVHSKDPRVDCIAACVGVRGVRLKNVIDALGGERVDLVRWLDSPVDLIATALQPAAIER